MRIAIHQGSATLGGNCVEIGTDAGSILLDAGLPVTGERTLDRSQFMKLLDRASALFISHPHPDHYALLAEVECRIPVYMSQKTRTIIEIAHLFGQTHYDPSQARTFEANGESIDVTMGNPEAPMTITPHSIGHSGFGSCAYHITDGCQSILYTGDLRDHGRRGHLMDQLIDRHKGNVDYLIMEGTTLNREYAGPRSEQEVQTQCEEAFMADDQLVLLKCSSQNIDRLVSIYKACLQTQRTFVLDPYTAYILKQLQCYSDKLPQYFWKNVAVLFASYSYTDKLDQRNELFQFRPAKVTKQEILENPGQYVLKSNGYVDNWLEDKRQLAQTTMIYSQWSGYIQGIWEDDRVRHIHCSGHANPETLDRLISGVNPGRVIPIHTEVPAEFANRWGKKV
ncbi:MAG: MBL fold metallo-hydrolase [Bacteroidota bacterium]